MDDAHLVADDVAVELVGRDEPHAIVVKGLSNFRAVGAPRAGGGSLIDPGDMAIHDMEASLCQDGLEQGDGDDGKGEGAHCDGRWGLKLGDGLGCETG